MKLTELIKHSTEAISRLYPEREAREMALAYLSHILGTTRHTHIIDPSYEVPSEKLEEIYSAVERMAGGEPLQYVTGLASFYGRDFHVTPSVLIPRPETEMLCRLAVQSIDEQRNRAGAGHGSAFRPKILDLCTGSGCIAWTMALEVHGSEVTAVDISEDALQVAASQDFHDEIACADVQAPQFVKADILSAVPSEAENPFQGPYDLILSNPPYVMDKEKSLMRSNVLDHEPHLALFVPDDDPLKFYRAVASRASALLSDDGAGIVEINEALGKRTADVFRSAGFPYVSIEKDLHDKERFVKFSRK